MIISSGENSITINNPEWGYSTDINMSTVVSKNSYGYDIWDNGPTYDVRICRIPRFLFSISQISDVMSFFLSEDNRNAEYTLNLGSNSGFFPFGADLGDSGEFTFKIVEKSISGILNAPWNYFGASFDMMMTSSPSYSVTTGQSEGNLTIGTVSGIMYPQDGFKPSADYGITNAKLPLSGLQIDTHRAIYTSEFELQLNTGKCGSLLSYLTGLAGRGNDITVTTPGNMYMFGPSNGSSGSYQTKLIQNVISVNHDNYDKFKTTLTMCKK